MSSSNSCFLTCIQISQEAGEVVWYSHLSQNFPQFIVIHTVKGFGIVNKAEIDVFLELSYFFHNPVDVGNLISGSSAFSKTSLNIRKFMVHKLLKPGLENFEHYFTSMWDCSCFFLQTLERFIFICLKVFSDLLVDPFFFLYVACCLVSTYLCFPHFSFCNWYPVSLVVGKAA